VAPDAEADPDGAENLDAAADPAEWYASGGAAEQDAAAERDERAAALREPARGGRASRAGPRAAVALAA
jgi:hypothetical protein